MERGRKTKIITIVALVVAIVTMSLGFAVFSNVLTISSSATVKPNAEDYVINIYGVAEEISVDVIFQDVNNLIPYMTSKTSSVPIADTIDSTTAIIDNKNFTISNLNATFSSGGQAILYIFLIKNEGKKSVYIDFANSVVTGNKTCVAGENTSQELVDNDCDKLYIAPGIVSSANEVIQNIISYEIAPGDYVLGSIKIKSTEYFEADGEFTVNFDDIQVAFTSIDNS